MEKIIKISGQDVPFKTNGIALLIYKAQLGRNLIPDILSIVGAIKVNELQEGQVGSIDIAQLDVQVLYDVCWTFAKIATPDIPPVLEWAAQFESFPIVDIFTEITPLLMECITSSAEVKNAVATASKTNPKPLRRNKLFLWQRK